MKRLLYFTLCLLWPVLTWGQRPEPRTWHLKGQFAGSIGLVSAGAGTHFLRDKLDADLYAGYLPSSMGGERIFTAALKGAYVPFEPVPLGPLGWRPLRTGLQLSYTFGDNYFAREPSGKYDKGYYGFSTALHLYYFISGELDFGGVRGLERFGVYYELGSLGEYLVSYVQNPDYLSIDKIFKLALGIRFYLN